MSQLKITSRVLHLPMAFRESKSKDAMAKYKSSVRPEAAYLPDNVPFVAKNNGLAGVDELQKIMFEASYMVFGLGDVYLGAPCAVPVNPLHRCDCGCFTRLCTCIEALREAALAKQRVVYRPGDSSAETLTICIALPQQFAAQGSPCCPAVCIILLSSAVCAAAGW